MKVKKSRWLVILMVVAMLFSLVPAMAGANNDCSDCVTLYAGQNIPVGTVCVSNDGEYLYVEYCIDDEYWDCGDGWGLYETKVHVGNALADFPLNRGGNPQVGHFDYKATHAGVQCYTQVIPLGDFTGDILIAAHADIKLPEISYTETRGVCIFSGVDTKILNDPYTDAVHTWEPDIWNQRLTEPLDEDAKWVWESFYVANPRCGDLVEFFEFFSLEGTLLSAELKIAADNAFEVNINDGDFIATENLQGDWRNQTEFTTEFLPDPNPSGWSQVYTYNVLGALVTGDNTMNVTGVNAAWPTDNPEVNPAGVRYELCVDYEVKVIEREADEESAWGAGTRFTEQGNWATYFCYEIQCVLVDTVCVTPDGTDPYIYDPTFSKDLPEGNYRLVASGTYRFANWGDFGIADALFNRRSPQYIPTDPDVDAGDGWYILSSQRLQVFVFGEAVDWLCIDTGLRTLNPDHTYSYEFYHDGGEIEFGIEDNIYGDNSGYITVKIYYCP